jgi:hypothetical protein
LVTLTVVSVARYPLSLEGGLCSSGAAGTTGARARKARRAQAGTVLTDVRDSGHSSRPGSFLRGKLGFTVLDRVRLTAPLADVDTSVLTQYSSAAS